MRIQETDIRLAYFKAGSGEKIKEIAVSKEGKQTEILQSYFNYLQEETFSQLPDSKLSEEKNVKKMIHQFLNDQSDEIKKKINDVLNDQSSKRMDSPLNPPSTQCWFV